MINNYIKQTLSLIALLLGMVLTAQERGSVSGIIVLSDNTPAENITIALKGTGYGAITNAKGYYEIKSVKAGKYTIRIVSVGIKPVEETITVTAGTETVKNFTLGESQEELNEVIINGGTNRYKQDKTSGTLRLDTPILNVPQNIQIVTAQALKDQQVISMSDGVIRNVSGTTRLEHWGDLYANITMRGSQIQAFRNGFNVVSSFWGPLTEDMSFVDHIEFVKGPAGFMLANGDPSGLYNVVTKKPTGIEKGEVSLTLGSFDLYRTTVDLDGKLSKDGKVQYRLNLAAQNKGSFRPYEHNDRYAIAPVISYQINDKTKATFEYNYQRANMTEVGSYYVFGTGGYATAPRDFTLTQPGLPDTKINDHSFYAMLEHQIDDHWKVTAQLAYFKYLQEGYSSWPSHVGPEYDANGTEILSAGEIIRNVGIWDAESSMKLGQVFLNGKFQTGQLSHKILAGLDMGNKNYIADWGQSHDLDTYETPFLVSAPNYGTPANGMPDFDRSTPLEERAQAIGGMMSSHYSAGYLQYELGLYDRVRLTVAGRYTSAEQASWGGAPISDNHWSPRAGLSMSVDENTSVYLLHDQAFTPQAGIMRSSETVKPLTGNNNEIGIKRDWFNGSWNTTLSIYRINKNNELMSDPTNTSGEQYSIVFGKRRAQGVEFDVRGNLLPGLNLVANYAITESYVSEVAAGITETYGIKKGDIVPGYSKHTANAWLTYTLQDGFFKGFGASGGFTFLGGRRTDTWSQGLDRLPDYFKLDGGLSYEKGNMKINANVYNILDKYLYSGSYYAWLGAYYWQAEAPRNLRLGITYKF